MPVSPENPPLGRVYVGHLNVEDAAWPQPFAHFSQDPPRLASHPRRPSRFRIPPTIRPLETRGRLPSCSPDQGQHHSACTELVSSREPPSDEGKFPPPGK